MNDQNRQTPVPATASPATMAGGRLPPDPPDAEPPDVPGYQNYRLYADESGFHNAPFYGYGALVIAHERRGDLTAMFDGLRDKHGFDQELKWSRVNSRNLPFAIDVIHQAFARPWMLFHCLVVEQNYVDMTFHEDWQIARRKHWTLFLRKKVEYFNYGASNKAYHIIVDTPPFSYKKAGEATHTIINHTLKRDIGSSLVRTLTSCDSRKMIGIQIADLFLGAVLAARQGEVTAPAKLRVMAVIADYIGWNDLNADTLPGELKFNIWNFQNPRQPRRELTRPLKLLIPHKACRKRDT
jgi:hypothetical protein